MRPSVKTGVLLLLLTITILVSSIEKMEVRNSSMAPGLVDGDVILVLTKIRLHPTKFTIRLFPIKRDWIYVFNKPIYKNTTENLYFYIKRCKAKPGDSIAWGKQNIEIWKKNKIRSSMPSEIFDRRGIDEFNRSSQIQGVYLMGDNCYASTDSRDYGCVKKSRIIGLFLCKVK